MKKKRQDTILALIAAEDIPTQEGCGSGWRNRALR